MNVLPEKRFTITSASPLIFFIMTAGIVALGTIGLYYYDFLAEMPFLWVIMIGGGVVIFIITIFQYYYQGKFQNYRYGDDGFVDLRDGSFHKWEELIWYKVVYSYSGKKIESLMLHFQNVSGDIRLEGIAELDEIYELIKVNTKSKCASSEDDTLEWNIPPVFRNFMWRKTLRRQLNVKNILMGLSIAVTGTAFIAFIIIMFISHPIELSAMIFMSVGMVFALGMVVFIVLNILNSFLKTIIVPDGLILLTQTDARKIFVWHNIENITEIETESVSYIELEYCNGETFYFGVDGESVKMLEVMVLIDKYAIKAHETETHDEDAIITIAEAPEELTACVASSTSKKELWLIIPGTVALAIVFLLYIYQADFISPDTLLGWGLLFGICLIAAMVLGVPLFISVFITNRNSVKKSYSRHGIKVKENFYAWKDLVTIAESQNSNSMVVFVFKDGSRISLGNNIAEFKTIHKIALQYSDNPIITKANYSKSSVIADIVPGVITWKTPIGYAIQCLPKALLGVWVGVVNYRIKKIIYIIVFELLFFICAYLINLFVPEMTIWQIEWRVHIAIAVVLIGIIIIMLIYVVTEIFNRLKIMLKKDEMVIISNDSDTIINYEKIIAYSIEGRKKYRVLALDITDNEKFEFALPKEPLCSQIIEHLEKKLSS